MQLGGAFDCQPPRKIVVDINDRKLMEGCGRDSESSAQEIEMPHITFTADPIEVARFALTGPASSDSKPRSALPALATVCETSFGFAVGPEASIWSDASDCPGLTEGL